MKNTALTLLLTILSFSAFADGIIGTHFIENNGQWTNAFQYKSYVDHGAMFFTKTGIVYNFYNYAQTEEIHEKTHDSDNLDPYNELVDCHAFKMTFVNANADAKIGGKDKQKYYQNYYLGKDRSTWRSKVGTYRKVEYSNLYDGIDLAYFATNTGMKYEFYVAPNANANSISLQLTGAQASLDKLGNLSIETSVGIKKELKPVSFQFIDGQKIEVETRFSLTENILTFDFPNGYDKNQKLIIDPVLIFATYSGGTSETYGWSAAYDDDGHLYAGGQSFATGWPVTMGSYQQTFGGLQDVGINKYTPTGTGLIFSTYLGGSGADLPSSMVCTSNDELVIAGYTGSSNFPTSAGAYQSTSGGGNDLFITSFDQAGTALIGSTYLGGSGFEGSTTQEVNLDATDNIYVASNTNSPNFPTTAGAYQTTFGGGTSDGLVVKMNLNCSSLLASTYLGGSDRDLGQGVLILSNGNIVTAGITSSANYPTTAGVLHTTFQGGFSDGYATIMDNNLSSLTASTYLGTSGDDEGYRSQEDFNGNIYVCGTSDTYPVSAGAYTNALGNVYFDKLNATLTTSLLSTRVGVNSGFGFLRPTAFLLDICENVYVSCQSASAGLPLSADAQQTTVGGLWVGVLTPNYGSLLYGSYIGQGGDHIDGGGSRFDPQGIIYQSICTNSSNIYSTIGGHSPTSQYAGYDIASMKLAFGYSSVAANFTKNKPDTVCQNEVIQFTSTSTSATVFNWDFGDGNTSAMQNPTHAYVNPGVYLVTLIAENTSVSCGTKDTIQKTITVAESVIPMITGYADTTCSTDPLTLALNVANENSNFSYLWTPAGAIVSNGNTKSPVVNPGASSSFNVLVIHQEYAGYCADSATATINIVQSDTSQMAASPLDTTVCLGDQITLAAVGGDTYEWSAAHTIANPSKASITETILGDIVYKVQIKDKFGCVATKYCDIKTIQIKADAGRDQIIRYGSWVQLDGSKSEGQNFEWNASPTLDNRFIANPRVNPLVNEDYILTSTNDLGCSDVDTVNVKVTNFSMPNAFSPNADGLNDRFRVIIPNNLVTLQFLRVFNRWGEKVFETNNVDISWDGTFKGEDCPIGTYYYTLGIDIGGEGFKYQGDINLIR